MNLFFVRTKCHTVRSVCEDALPSLLRCPDRICESAFHERASILFSRWKASAVVQEAVEHAHLLSAETHFCKGCNFDIAAASHVIDLLTRIQWSFLLPDWSWSSPTWASPSSWQRRLPRRIRLGGCLAVGWHKPLFIWQRY